MIIVCGEGVTFAADSASDAGGVHLLEDRVDKCGGWPLEPCRCPRHEESWRVARLGLHDDV